MVKHTQTIRLQFANELFECVSSFCRVGVAWVNSKSLRNTAVHFVNCISRATKEE